MIDLKVGSECKGRALFKVAAHLNLPFVGVHDLLANVESQASPVIDFSVFFLDVGVNKNVFIRRLVKTKDVFHGFSGHANALVSHFNNQSPLPFS